MTNVPADPIAYAAQVAGSTLQMEVASRALGTLGLFDALWQLVDDDTQQLFFDLLDRFTPTHVRLLTLLSDPLRWFERHGISRPNIYMGPKTAIVEAGMPELADRRDLIDRYAGALSAAGLVNQSLSGIMTENGLWAKATTSLASEFLAFIADPESKVD